MADRPMLQALFHSNAGLQHFYYAPYEVAAFVAAPFAAMFLVSPFFTLSAGAVLLSKHRNCKAFAAADVILHDFIYGTSTRQRFYYQNSVDTQSLMQSQGIHEALRQIRQQRRIGQTHGFGYTGSWQALAYIPHDLLYSPIGGQVGGDTWEWGLDSGRIQMHVHNDAGANSFFFHAVPNLPDGLNAPFNTVHQDFFFSVPDE